MNYLPELILLAFILGVLAGLAMGVM